MGFNLAASRPHIPHRSCFLYVACLRLTTDGLAAYRMNVPFAFQSQVDFAVLIKNYQSTQETTRYSPAKITNIEKLPMFGDCDEDRISTPAISSGSISPFA